MRIWCLPFLFALILFGSSTALLAAVGEASRCLPPKSLRGKTKIANANALFLESPQPLVSLDHDERDYLIRTIVFEATGETEQGKAAVAHVILNRKRIGLWGDNIKDVVTHPWQFEPWMTKRRAIKNLAPNDPSYRSVARIADAVLAGEIADPTLGATHFLNPVIVRERRGGSLPKWARGEGMPIGRHIFYTVVEDGVAAPPRDAGYLTTAGYQVAC
jgi:spore germination cell wall hydrolase CwlJ-like protein